jgi:hypothetical protein
MAKVTITIEDLPGNKVKVISDPSLETMFKMNLSGGDMTSAHGYAFAALNAIRRESKTKDPSPILIPKVRGGGV